MYNKGIIANTYYWNYTISGNTVRKGKYQTTGTQLTIEQFRQRPEKL
jgi:hypothetical protein